MKAGRYAEARTIFEKAIDQNEKNVDAHVQLGTLHLIPAYQDRDLDEAVDHLEAAIETEPKNPQYLFLLGAAYGMKAQTAGIIKQAFLAPKVKKTFERVVELDPKHVQARIGLAQYLLNAPGIMGGDSEAGWKQLEEVVRLDEVQGRMVRARAYEREKRTADAESDWKALTKSHSGNWRVWKGMAGFHLRGERYDEALKGMRRYVEIRPDTADSYASLGEVLLKKGDADEAKKEIDRAVRLEPDLPLGHYLLAEWHFEKGDKQNARGEYERYLAVAQPMDSRRKAAEERLKQLK